MPTTRLVLYGRILPASDRRLLRSLRRAPGRPAGAPAARGQPARNAAPGREQHDAHVHPPRGLARPAHPAGRDQARRRRPAARPTSVTPRRKSRSCWPRSRSARTGSTRWWATCWTCPGSPPTPSAPSCAPVRWYEVIPGALQRVPPGRVRVELPANMPEIDADPGMLERVIANIVENAVKYAPDSDIVVVGQPPAGSARPRSAGVPRASCGSSTTAGVSRRRGSWRCSVRSSGSTTTPQGRRRRAGPGRGEGIHRGDGRTAGGGGDAGRRPDHGDHACRSPPACPLMRHRTRPRWSRSRR